MFGKMLLEGIIGKEVEFDKVFAFGLGQRLAKRCHYASTRLQVMAWIDVKDWQGLREWLLKDLPGEAGLPVPNAKNLPPDINKREVIALTLTGAWHALKSYEYGNSATELAQEMCERIESTARMLGITLEGVEAETNSSQP